MTGRRSRTPAAPVSYSLSIPLGWIRVPGGLDRDSTLAAVQDQVDPVDDTGHEHDLQQEPEHGPTLAAKIAGDGLLRACWAL